MVTASQVPFHLPQMAPFDPVMRPPVIKVIDTPEEAAKMLQHHPAKEKTCELLKLNSLVVKMSAPNKAGHGGADDRTSQTCHESALTLTLSPLDQSSHIELGDWVECCATTPFFGDQDQLAESFGSPATSTGRAGFVAFGCADGEILLLKSSPAGEETLDSVRFLGHGDPTGNFEAATLSLCFSSPVAQRDADDETRSGASGSLLASSGEDGKLRVWSVDSLLSGKGAAQSLCCEITGLDAVQTGADYRRRIDKDGKSIRVPSVQLVACSCTSFTSTTATDTVDGVGSTTHANLAVAVGRSVWLVELSSDWCRHRRSVQLGCIHSTATALQFADLPDLGTSLLAACYGAVSIWDEATLQRGTEAPPNRTLDYKGPLLGLCISMGGAFVGAGCQDGTMHVWKIAADNAGLAAGSAVEEADSASLDAADTVKTDQRLRERVRTKAAITEVSCGGYSEKVTCSEWSTGGFFLATAGGQHAIVWDFTDTQDQGSKDATFPVGKKEAAAICCGHERRVTAIAFGPCTVDAQTQEVSANFVVNGH
jgi:WD40 repeat protein